MSWYFDRRRGSWAASCELVLDDAEEDVDDDDKPLANDLGDPFALEGIAGPGSRWALSRLLYDGGEEWFDEGDIASCGVELSVG